MLDLRFAPTLIFVGGPHEVTMPTDPGPEPTDVTPGSNSTRHRIVHRAGGTDSVPLSCMCEETQVGGALRDHAICVCPRLPLTKVLQKMVKHGAPALTVVDAEARPLGIVSRADLLRLAGNGQLESCETRLQAFDPNHHSPQLVAEDAMTLTPVLVSADDHLLVALNLLEETGVHQLVVVDADRRVIGLLTGIEAARLALAGADDTSTVPKEQTRLHRSPPDSGVNVKGQP